MYRRGRHASPVGNPKVGVSILRRRGGAGAILPEENYNSRTVKTRTGDDVSFSRPHHHHHHHHHHTTTTTTPICSTTGSQRLLRVVDLSYPFDGLLSIEIRRGLIPGAVSRVSIPIRPRSKIAGTPGFIIDRCQDVFSRRRRAAWCSWMGKAKVGRPA